MNNNVKVIGLLLTVLSFSAQSEALEESRFCTEECFYINGMVGGAIGKNNDSDDQFQRLGGGYHLTDMIDFGFAWSFIGNDDDKNDDSNNQGVEGYLRMNGYLDKDTKIYLDAGMRDDLDNFMAGVGFLYAITPVWDLDLGYRYYNEPNSTIQGDVYTFGIGLQYNFRTDKQDTPVLVEETTDITADEIEETQIADTEVEATEEETPSCIFVDQQKMQEMGDSVQLASHTIVDGEWPLQIARDNCVSYNVLIQANPWLAKRINAQKHIKPGEMLSIPKIQ